MLFTEYLFLQQEQKNNNINLGFSLFNYLWIYLFRQQEQKTININLGFSLFIYEFIYFTSKNRNQSTLMLVLVNLFIIYWFRQQEQKTLSTSFSFNLFQHLIERIKNKVVKARKAIDTELFTVTCGPLVGRNMRRQLGHSLIRSLPRPFITGVDNDWMKYLWRYSGNPKLRQSRHWMPGSFSVTD